MQLTDPSAELAAKNVGELADMSTFDLSAYWLAVAGNRDEYAANLGAILAPQGVPVLIVRKQRFDNANYLSVDLARLLEENQGAVLAGLRRRGLGPHRPAVVLLARTELPVLQSDSPVIWPEWVPNVGGKEVPCLITDITRRINVRMDDPEAKSFEVNRALHAVESALVRRLIAVSERDATAHLRLFAAIKRPSDVSWTGFLGKAKTSLRDVSTTESYRPNGKKGDSVVSRLWGVAQSGSHADILAMAVGLKEALRISNCDLIEDWREGLFSALGRSHLTGESKADEFSRAVVHTVSASCQYITCAMHGHEYQRFPLQLVTSAVADLSASLRAIEACLNLLPLEDEQRHARTTIDLRNR
jgi:hypothetical protein